MFQCLLAANQGSNERQKHFDCINFASFTILIIILIIAALLDLLVIIVASPPPSAQLVERRQDEQKGHFAQNEKTVDVCGGKYIKSSEGRPVLVKNTAFNVAFKTNRKYLEASSDHSFGLQQF